MNAQSVAQEALLTRDQIAVWCRTQRTREAAVKEGLRMTVDWVSRALQESSVLIWIDETYRVAVSGAEALIGSPVTRADVENAERLAPFWYCADFILTNARCRSVFITTDEARNDLRFMYLEQPFNEDDWDAFTGWDIAIGDLVGSVEQARAIACLRFLQLKVEAETKAVHLPRPLRRRAAREGIELPAVRIVQLREAEPSGISQEGRRLRNRAVWRGFWRRLSRPLKRDSRVSGGKRGDEIIWVRPSVRGPQGAPLLPQRESVYAVTR